MGETRYVDIGDIRLSEDVYYEIVAYTDEFAPDSSEYRRLPDEERNRRAARDKARRREREAAECPMTVRVPDGPHV